MPLVSLGHGALILDSVQTGRGTSGQEMANDKVSKPQEGDQGQVGGPQVPLLGHGNEIKSPN